MELLPFIYWPHATINKVAVQADKGFSTFKEYGTKAVDSSTSRSLEVNGRAEAFATRGQTKRLSRGAKAC
jgi:hypothetical protein